MLPTHGRRRARTTGCRWNGGGASREQSPNEEGEAKPRPSRRLRAVAVATAALPAGPGRAARAAVLTPGGGTGRDGTRRDATGPDGRGPPPPPAPPRRALPPLRAAPSGRAARGAAPPRSAPSPPPAGWGCPAVPGCPPGGPCVGRASFRFGWQLSRGGPEPGECGPGVTGGGGGGGSGLCSARGVARRNAALSHYMANGGRFSWRAEEVKCVSRVTVGLFGCSALGSAGGVSSSLEGVAALGCSSGTQFCCGLVTL